MRIICVFNVTLLVNFGLMFLSGCESHVFFLVLQTVVLYNLTTHIYSKKD